MALYTYRALSPAGKTEKGTLVAASEGEVKARLQARHVYPMEIRPAGGLGFRLRGLLQSGRERGMDARRLAQFARQFAALLNATIPYDAALGMIIEQTPGTGFKTALSDVRARVEEGADLAGALGNHPQYFPPMMVHMVRSGETAGTLDVVMERLADYYDHLARLRARITSALVYPAFMTVFGIAVVSFLVTYVIPRITRLFEAFEATLPLPTRLLIALSDIIIGYWWLLLLAVVAAGWGAARFMRTERGRALWDRLELAVPVWQGLRRKMILQRFSQTLATMLHSGVELDAALRVATEVMENRVYLAAMDRVMFDVQNKGLSLSVALRRTELFPEELCQMVAIGEETATLDRMLDNAARRFGQEVNASLDAATALFEPVMIIAMGMVVAFIVVAILLPMLQLNQLVGR